MKEGMGGGGGGGGMADIFDLFGGGGGGRRQTRERRGDNVTHRLKTSLEEMYTGALRYCFHLLASCLALNKLWLGLTTL